jgi:hypothetical protein
MSGRPGTGEMHHGNRPRNLQDISHLFLSSAASKKEAGRGTARALIFLTFPAGGPWRAFFSAGFASAMTTLGLDVELIETGRSLPSAAYYFGMNAAGYLDPVIRPDTVVMLQVGPSLGFRYAQNPSLIKPSEGMKNLPGRAKVMLFAFEAERGIEFETSVAGTAAECLGVSMERSGKGFSMGVPAGLVTYGSPGGRGDIKRVEMDFETFFPESPTWRISTEKEKPRPDKKVSIIVEHIYIPGGVMDGLARRSPPSSVFFVDIASMMLQRLSSTGGEKD